MWKDRRRFLALGALNGSLPFALIATSELYLPASPAAILNATTPLFSALVGASLARAEGRRPHLIDPDALGGVPVARLAGKVQEAGIALR